MVTSTSPTRITITSSRPPGLAPAPRKAMPRLTASGAVGGKPNRNTARRPSETVPVGILMEPPEWTLRVGLAGAGLALVCGLIHRAAGMTGMGMIPYVVALGVCSAYLLWMDGYRVEVRGEQVTAHRGEHVLERCALRDFENIHGGFLNKTLEFRGGRRITVPDLWTHSDRVTAFFHRGEANRIARQREGDGAAQLRSNALIRMPTSRPRAAATRVPAMGQPATS